MSWFLKYRKPLFILTGLLVCFCFLSMDSAFAAGSTSLSVESYANSTGGSEKTYDLLTNPNTHITGFDNIIREIGTGMVKSARYIVAILIAASGIMVAFGVEDGKKTMWSVILGIGLALNLGSFLYTAYGTYLGAPPATEQGQGVEFQPLIPKDITLTDTQQAAENAYKKAAEENYQDILSPKQNPSTAGGEYHFFSSFISSYVNHVIQPGAQNLKGILIKLALLITLIDASLKIALELTGSGVVKLMISLALKLGFNIFLIDHWLTGIGLTQSLCNGFEELGFIAGGESTLKGNELVLSGLADGSVKAGFSIFSAFTGIICDGLSIFSQPFLILFGLILMVFFLIGMVWLALEMFMAQIEFYTMALLTMMLLPFMMSQHTSFLSNNAIAAMFNCAMKVCVIAFLSVVGMSTLGRYFNSLMANTLKPQNFTSLLLQFDITVLVLLFLVWQMPKLVQGLLSGSPQFGAGQMVSMIASGVSTVATVAGGVAGGMALGAAGGAAAEGAGGATGGAAGGGAAGGPASKLMSALNNIGGGGSGGKETGPGMEARDAKPDMSKYNSEAPSTPGSGSGGGMDAKNTNTADKSSGGSMSGNNSVNNLDQNNAAKTPQSDGTNRGIGTESGYQPDMSTYGNKAPSSASEQVTSTSGGSSASDNKSKKSEEGDTGSGTESGNQNQPDMSTYGNKAPSSALDQAPKSEGSSTTSKSEASDKGSGSESGDKKKEGSSDSGLDDDSKMSKKRSLDAAGVDAAGMKDERSGSGSRLERGFGSAIGNALTHAAFNSGPVKAFQQGYNAVTDPYGVGPAGIEQGASRSWKSGHMVDAQGNVIDENRGSGSRGSSGSVNGSDGKSPETDGVEERQHEKQVKDNIVTVHSANITDQGGATMDLNVKGQDIRVTVNPIPPQITPFNPNGK